MSATVHRGDLRIGPAFLQLQLGHHQVDLVVVHHQDAQGFVAQVVIGQNHKEICALRRLQGDLKPETSATPFLAVHPDLTPVKRHQFFAQRQTQTRAAKRPVGLHIGVFEAPKNMRLQFTGNAPSRVLHLQAYALALGLHAHRYRSLVGEFDGVVDQVVQDLQQAVGVAVHPRRQISVPLKMQGQAFVVCFFTVSLLQLVLQGLQGKIHTVQAHLARLQLRKIQDVVDHLQQMFG